MSYFTTGKSRRYEKLMTQKSHPMREDRKPVLPKDPFALAVSATAKAAYTPATVRCAGVLLWRCWNAACNC